MNERSKPEDAWLLKAEVFYKIEEVKSRWKVSLIFMNPDDSEQILVREIGDYRSERLAEIYARNMRQCAAKEWK